jgi:hypothetical protein
MGDLSDAWSRAAPGRLGAAIDSRRSERHQRRKVRRRLLAVLVGGTLFRLVMAGPVAEPARQLIASADVLGAPQSDPAPPTAPAPPPAASATASPPSTATPPTTKAPKPKAPPTTRPPVAATPPARASAAAVTALVPARAGVAGAVTPYKGLGTWVDVYDWSLTYTKGQPTVGPDDVNRMAAAGVQTLYIQAARGDTPDGILEADRLREIVDRAHTLHIAVVGWFLPYLTDPANDLRHLQALAGFGFEGVGVDIESTDVKDVNDRNQRLIDLSTAFRSSAPGVPLAAIVLPPVILEVVNPSYWPNFPWREIAPSYDVWMPMGYWTNRSQSSGYRDAHRYTSENVIRLRNNIGQPAAPVHPIGGVADEGTPADDDGFLRAAVETKCIGGSVYDWQTTGPEEWPSLQGFRA